MWACPIALISPMVTPCNQRQGGDIEARLPVVLDRILQKQGCKIALRVARLRNVLEPPRIICEQSYAGGLSFFASVRVRASVLLLQFSRSSMLVRRSATQVSAWYT